MPEKNMLILAVAGLVGIGTYVLVKRNRARNTAGQFWTLPDGTQFPVPDDIAGEAIALSSADEYCPDARPEINNAIDQFGADLAATGNPRLALNNMRQTVQQVCPEAFAANA